MAEHTLFVGLDVHKRTIAVATAPEAEPAERVVDRRQRGDHPQAALERHL